MSSHRQNYINKMEAKKQARYDAGLLSEKFPTVLGIVIHMIYYHKAENPVLMQRTVNIFPASYAYFHMECMIKTCEGGGFDLKSAITKQIKQKKATIKGTMSCKSANKELPTDHGKIDYDVKIKYSRKKLKK